MGLISTALGLIGFGWGISIGILVGYFLFIYLQPIEVKVIHPTFSQSSSGLLRGALVWQGNVCVTIARHQCRGCGKRSLFGGIAGARLSSDDSCREAALFPVWILCCFQASTHIFMEYVQGFCRIRLSGLCRNLTPKLCKVCYQKYHCGSNVLITTGYAIYQFAASELIFRRMIADSWLDCGEQFSGGPN